MFKQIRSLTVERVPKVHLSVSLTMTDIYTTWTECRSLFTKNGKEVRKQLIQINRTLPFKILAMNSDSEVNF